MNYQLEVSNITKSYGDLKANDDVSLNIKDSSIHALLGENGAGKSTLVKIIYGSLMPDSGEMKWDGSNYNPKSPFEARENGIAMVFQHFSLFESLTVEENIILGLDGVGLNENFTDEILKYSRQYGLDINPQQVVGDLSVGARQRVEIIRCLLQKPKLLIMDEPTSVLTPQEVSDLFVTLRKLADDGCSILYISHKLEEVREICSEATILRGGKLVQSCVPQEHSQKELAEMMIGKKLTELARSNINTGSDIFSIKNLSCPSDDMFGVDLTDISLTLKQGSIVGIAGVAGNGQDELMELLIGEKATDNDVLYFDGHDINKFSLKSIRNNIAYIPQEPVLFRMTIGENLRYAKLNATEEELWKALELANAYEFVNNLPDKLETNLGNMGSKLSGGQRQRIILARIFLKKPSLLILDAADIALSVNGFKFLLSCSAINNTAIILL